MYYYNMTNNTSISKESLGKYITIIKSDDPKTNIYKGYVATIQKILHYNFIIQIEANGNYILANKSSFIFN